MKYKGVVFDFDGTLADSEVLQKKKWDIVLAPFGITVSAEEYAQDYCGKSSADEIPMLLKRKYPLITYSVGELAQAAADILEELFTNEEIELMPGVLEAIRFFKEKGIKMTVCSAKDIPELVLKLKAAGLEQYFEKEKLSSQKEAGGLGKPDPAMYLYACQQLELEPQDCLSFEDMVSGAKSAKAAGLFVIGMPSQYSQVKELEENTDLIIKGGFPEFLKKAGEIL